MGRKVESMSLEQAREALEAIEKSFRALKSIYSLIEDCYSKSSYIPQRYTNAWRALQKFQGLIELEVERACLA